MWRHSSVAHYKCKVKGLLSASLGQENFIDHGKKGGEHEGMIAPFAPVTGPEDLELDLDGDPDAQARDYDSIYYHLHLADELVEWVKRAIDSGEATKFTGNTFRNLEEHMQILEGLHPRQERHMPKPEHWQPDQLARMEKLRQFIDETRPKLTTLLQPTA